MSTGRADADGVGIAYDVVGTGPHLLLIHGFTGDRTTMATLAEALGHHRTVISIDLVGHGESASPVDLDRYSMPAATRQLAAVLDDIGSSSADVVGYSLGGRVALSFACARPDLLRTLALIGASPGLPTPAAEERRATDEALADSIEIDGLDRFVDRWMALPMWRSLEARLGAEAWHASRQQRLTNSSRGLANSLRGMGTGAMPALHDRLGTLDVPTLLITGAEDTKFCQIALDMAAALPDASTCVIEQAGHAAHLEQPDAASLAIIEHLRCS